MAGKLQGITLEIGGDTKKLNDALKSTNDQIYSTQNELKQVEKLLKLDPKNTELLSQKQKLLGDQIGATKDKLEKLKEAEKQAKESGLNNTEEGQKAYRELQREISNTESRLKDLNKQNKEFGSVGLQQVTAYGKEMQNLGGKIESVGKKMSLVSGAIVGAFTTSAVQTASYADEILTLSAQTGIATDELQILKKTEELIDVPLETMTKSYAKLTKTMATASKGTGASAEAFKSLGINITGADGALRSNQDVFSDTIKALANIENETQRDAYAMQIFGKSAQDLNPLIKGGVEVLDEYGKKLKESGQIMGEDMLEKAADLDDKIQILKMSFAQVGLSLGTALLPIAEKVADFLTGLVDKLNSMDEGTKNTIVTIGLIVAAIGPAVLIIGKLISAVGTIMTLIPLITSPIGLIVIGITAVVTALVVLYNKCEWFRNMVDTLIQWLVTAFEFFFNAYKAIFDKVKAVIDWYIEYQKACFEVVIKFFTETIPNVWNAFVEFIKAGFELLISYILDPIGTIKGIFEALLPQASQWAKSVIDKIKQPFSKVRDIGENLVKGIFNGIKDATQWLYDKLKGWVSDVLDFVKGLFGIASPSKVMRDQVGKYLAQGIGVGFEKEMPSVIDDMADACKEVSEALSNELDFNAMPNINKAVTQQNYYTNKSYQNTTEVIRQPSEVVLQIDKTQFGRVVVPAYNQQIKIVGARL